MTYSLFSQRSKSGDRPHVVAFGEQLCVAIANSGSTVLAQDGTSYSTPFITGIVALLLVFRNVMSDSLPHKQEVCGPQHVTRLRTALQFTGSRIIGKENR